MSVSPQDTTAALTPRDIDIVVLNASLQELAKCFWDMLFRRTRFGGLHLVKNLTDIGEVHFDIWPLSETWALKHFCMPLDMKTFVLTPFLNLDAIAIELYPKFGHQRIVIQNGFYDGFTDKLIDINFPPNPFPDVCVVRALIMAVRLRFALSLRLASFILSRADETGSFAEHLVKAQVSHYGHVRCPADELNSWLVSIEKQLSEGRGRIDLDVPTTRQLELWSDHPPMHALFCSTQHEDEKAAMARFRSSSFS
jgi:hypothetical protein